MTSISPNPTGLPPGLSGIVGNDLLSVESSGPSFADTLAALLDNVFTGGDGQGGAPGKLPRFVERFDADGFLQTGVELPAGTPISLPLTVFPAELDERSSVQGGPKASIVTPALPASVVAVDPIVRLAEAAKGSPTPLLTVTVAKPSLAEVASFDPPHSSETVAASASPTTPGLFVNSRTGSPTERPAPIVPTRTIRAPDSEQAASPIAVTLDDTGEVVSVTVASMAAIDSEPLLREAVARTLARHGLVLGDLRINRRTVAGQKNGRE